MDTPCWSSAPVETVQWIQSYETSDQEEEGIRHQKKEGRQKGFIWDCSEEKRAVHHRQEKEKPHDSWAKKEEGDGE
jgi:hypothetical protein